MLQDSILFERLVRAGYCVQLNPIEITCLSNSRGDFNRIPGEKEDDPSYSVRPLPVSFGLPEAYHLAASMDEGGNGGNQEKKEDRGQEEEIMLSVFRTNPDIHVTYLATGRESLLSLGRVDYVDHSSNTRNQSSRAAFKYFCSAFIIFTTVVLKDFLGEESSEGGSGGSEGGEEDGEEEEEGSMLS